MRRPYDSGCELIAERAASHDALTRADLERWRAAMDEARARRLQPHYVRAFFLAAFKLLGGAIAGRETGRYEIQARANRRPGTRPADRHRHAGAAPVRAGDLRP